MNSRRRRRVVRRLAGRDGPGCAYCGAELTPGPASGPLAPSTRTIDHVVPRSKGGRDDLGNLALCCLACNAAKGPDPLEIFLRTAHREA